MDSNNQQFGYSEDLIAELEYKLGDLLSHIKLLSNATVGIGADFSFDIKDINSISQTLHDKAVNSLFVVEKLKASLVRLSV